MLLFVSAVLHAESSSARAKFVQHSGLRRMRCTLDDACQVLIIVLPAMMIGQAIYKDAEAIQNLLRTDFSMPTTAQQQQLAHWREQVDLIVRSVNALWR